MTRHRDAAAYQSTQLTGRPGTEILDDLQSLEVSGTRVAERGKTYVVFAPHERRPYSTSLAVTLAIVTTLVVLIVTAASVVLIILLPLALVPFIPLMLDDRPQLAVGAVPDEPDASSPTRVTAHGRVWADLGPALDAYLGNLPRPDADRADPEDGETVTAYPSPPRPVPDTRATAEASAAPQGAEERTGASPETP